MRINVVRLDLSGNRMRRKPGYRIADMLLLNKTVADLDLSDNALDSQVRHKTKKTKSLHFPIFRILFVRVACCAPSMIGSHTRAKKQ